MPMAPPRFSERYGLTPPRALQTDALDSETRTALWNLIYHRCFAAVGGGDYFDGPSLVVATSLWTKSLKQPIHRLPSTPEACVPDLFDFFVGSKWFEVMNAIERCGALIPDFREDCNDVLESQAVAYRFVDRVLTRLTTPEEVAEVQRALDATKKDPIAGARIHLISALEKLGQVPKPDERNAIKEAISAVEVVARRISGGGNTLGDALKRIDIGMNGALRGGLEKIYGWTNGPDGIRHAMMEESTLKLEDGRFMVIACSAFVNYLLVKADRAGVRF